MKGYDELRGSAAWVELPGRGKIEMRGDDRVRLLHAMCTNHIEQLQPGQGCYAFFLNAQGRILADANVLALPGRLLLDTEPEAKERLYNHLDAFIIADDVTLADRSAELATIAVEGPQADRLLAGAGIHAPAEAFAHVEWRGGLAVRASFTGSPGVFLFVPAEQREGTMAQLRAAGIAEAEPATFHTVRLEHGKPRYGEDISDRFLAQETNQLHALHFQKGCYLGQEIVERVRSRAQIHRRLMPIAIEGTAVPGPGAKLLSGDKPAGEITSAAWSPAFHKVVALGYVRVEFERPGAELSLDGARAVVGLPASG